jgi:DNA polymerase I
MSEIKQMITNERVEQFLQGSDPEKYIIAVEAEYNEPTVTLVINDPNTGKKTRQQKYEPFLWFKHDIVELLYGGNRTKVREACEKFSVKITKLRTSDNSGYTPERMENGYKYLAKCKGSYNLLINFFKDGGIDIFKLHSKSFILFSPTEQFLIQTGKRLFKGMDDYNDLNRFQFDLETEGLLASKNAIFQIGVRNNKGMEYVLETNGNTAKEKRDSELENIKSFFKIIDAVKPDVIAGYNSENFDWPFIFDRAERLGMNVSDLAITLNRIHRIKRKPATLKLGGETEAYNQTYMYGYNIIDISHAVRRAMAINSEIKSWGLKYITQYSGIAKPNRVYVPGDKINSTWADKVNKYAFNDTNGDWYKINNKTPLKDGYKTVTGKYIVERYLCDDLWETEQIDNLYNQASFLIAKMLPTTFMRSSTMGTAGQWKLIMAAWSYENKLTIPETQQKRDFTGGLSRLLEVGYAKNVVKLDFAALYPKTQLTWGIFPDLDISGVMRGILTYVVDTRDHYKSLTGAEKSKAKKLQKVLDENKNILSSEEIQKLKNDIAEHKRLSTLYDKKQLPLKILANSWFGSYGAPYIFNWGDTDSAEETTCRGRQALRLMVKHFSEKHGFKPLVGDSVTHDTPVYLKNKKTNLIEILPICDLFDEITIDVNGQQRDFSPKEYQILTRSGWKEIKYVYRHGTDKKIHRITTKDRLINVTEDHSLFQNGIKVKPSELKRFDIIDTYELPNNNTITDISLDKAFLMGFFLGDGSANCSSRIHKYKSRKTGIINFNKSKRSDWKISNTRINVLERLKDILKKEFLIDGFIKDHNKSSGVYNLVVHKVEFAKFFCDEFYTSYREKKVPTIILNSSTETKRAFIEGVFASDGYGDTIETCSDIGMKSQIAMCGISMLLKELNIDYKITTRKDKQNFISFNLKNKDRNNLYFTDKTKKKTNEVWKNEIISNKDKNNYVYDVSTEDGSFISGIGGVSCSNTDGFNFSFPDNINEIKYIAKGNHWKTIGDAGKELTGLDAVLADFNENYMEGRMGLDIDDICNSTINFARKNYANDIDGKIKLVGNSVKSKKMSVYIEDFLAKAIRMLLDGDGYSFINYYYQYVDKIYNYQIPLVKMASKAKVKSTMEDYKKKATMKNKAGNPMPKQAHMELALRNNINVTLGDTLYYINTGTSKGQGDLKTINRSKLSKRQMEKYIEQHGAPPASEVTVQLNCKLIDPKIVERDFELIKEVEMLNKALLELEDDPESQESIKERIDEINGLLFTDEYNVNKYLESFNKKVKPLLVCFDTEIRDKILLSIVKQKDKTTKMVVEKLKERTIFSRAECTLVSGKPLKEADQDSYEELMTMEDKEIKFWAKVNKIPNYIDAEEWEKIKLDYLERAAKAKAEGLTHEKELLDNIFKKLEVKDLNKIIEKHIMPNEILSICDVDNGDSGNLISRKWKEPLCHVNDIFKYENEAVERNRFYKLNNIQNDENCYELWLDYIEQQNPVDSEVEVVKPTEKTEPINKKLGYDDEFDEEEDEGEEEEDNTNDEEIKLDDEFDDTFPDAPEDYVFEEQKEDESDDGWLF